MKLIMLKEYNTLLSFEKHNTLKLMNLSELNENGDESKEYFDFYVLEEKSEEQMSTVKSAIIQGTKQIRGYCNNTLEFLDIDKSFFTNDVPSNIIEHNEKDPIQHSDDCDACDFYEGMKDNIFSIKTNQLNYSQYISDQFSKKNANNENIFQNKAITQDLVLGIASIKKLNLFITITDNCFIKVHKYQKLGKEALKPSNQLFTIHEYNFHLKKCKAIDTCQVVVGYNLNNEGVKTGYLLILDFRNYDGKDTFQEDKILTLYDGKYDKSAIKCLATFSYEGYNTTEKRNWIITGSKDNIIKICDLEKVRKHYRSNGNSNKNAKSDKYFLEFHENCVMNLNTLYEKSYWQIDQCCNGYRFNHIEFLSPNILITAALDGEICIYIIPKHILSYKTEDDEMLSTETYPKEILRTNYDHLFGITSIAILKTDYPMSSFHRKKNKDYGKITSFTKGSSHYQEENDYSIDEECMKRSFLVVYTILGTMEIFDIVLEFGNMGHDEEETKKDQPVKSDGIIENHKYYATEGKQIKFFCQCSHYNVSKVITLEYIKEKNAIVIVFPRSTIFLFFKEEFKRFNEFYNLDRYLGFNPIYGGLLEVGGKVLKANKFIEPSHTRFACKNIISDEDLDDGKDFQMTVENKIRCFSETQNLNLFSVMIIANIFCIWESCYNVKDSHDCDSHTKREDDKKFINNFGYIFFNLILEILLQCYYFHANIFFQISKIV